MVRVEQYGGGGNPSKRVIFGQHQQQELKIASHIMAKMRIKHLFIFLLAAASTLSHAATITGTVVSVADGDTVTVLDATKTQHKIRLTGIDAPEKAQPFGRRSKSSLSDMVYLKQVTVETDKKDRYGRNLGKVLIDGKDANLMQIERGFAWHYKAYERDQSSVDRKAYADAENAARASRTGLVGR